MSTTSSSSSRFVVALALAGVTGFISMSQEILWLRAAGFADMGKPTTFSHVLGMFLVGIAIGSWVGKWICDSGKLSPVTYMSASLFGSAVVYFLSLPIIGAAYGVSPAAVHGVEKTFGEQVSLLAICAVAAFQGGIFPALCDYGVARSDRAGQAVSYLYFSNIVGSTLGPLLTGFVLLNAFSLQSLALVFSIATLLLAIAVPLALSEGGGSRRYAPVGVAAVLALGMVASHGSLYGSLLEKLQMKEDWAKYPFVYTSQSRGGIVTLTRGADMDLIWGGGVYDGGMSIDPLKKGNGIERAYVIPLLHPAPKDVLEIGMSGGAWAAALLQWEDLNKLDIVEISPGYFDVMERYPDVAPVLTHPKVTIHVDDGRRWLKRNPEKKYDFILFNASFHWRAHATNILSIEFMKLAKQHLKPGGVFYFNTTGSIHAHRTPLSEFAYMVRPSNFVALSDTPFDMGLEAKWANLAKFKHTDGRPVFDMNDPGLKAYAEKLVKLPPPDERQRILTEFAHVGVITDDNMWVEFRLRPPLADPAHRWGSLFDRVFAQ